MPYYPPTAASGPLSQLLVYGTDPNVPTAIIRGAVAQAAPLTRWADSSGTQIAHVRNDGLIGAPYFTNNADNGPYMSALPETLSFIGRGADVAYPIVGISTHLAGKMPLVVSGHTGQTAPLTQWRNVGGTPLAAVDNLGFMSAAGYSAVGGFIGNGGDLLGGYNGSYSRIFSFPGLYFDTINAGADVVFRSARNVLVTPTAGNVGLIVQGAAAQTADLFQARNSAGTPLAGISPNGAIWSQGGSSFTTIQNPNAAVAQLSTYTDSTHGMTIASMLAAYVPLSVKGAVNQTADLLQLQNSAGAISTRFSWQGNLGIGTTGAPQAPLHVRVGTDQNMLHSSFGYGAGLAIYNDAMTALGDLTLYGNKILLAPVNSGAVGVGVLVPMGKLHVSTDTAAQIGLIVQAVAAQTGDIQQWQGSSTSVFGRVDSIGVLGFGYGRFGPSHSLFDYNALRVTGQSAGSATAVIKAIAAQTAPLTEFQSSTGAIVAQVTAAGQFAEKAVTFTPTGPGWYRICSGLYFMGGTVRINGTYDVVRTDVEFQYNISGYTQGGAIQQTRFGFYNAGAVATARISSDGTASCYLDIEVLPAATYGPITVHASGLEQPALVAAPVVGAVAGSSNVTTLPFGHGFRTTSAVDFGSTVGTKLNLYAGLYGVGIQANRLVLYVSSGDAVAIRSTLTGADIIRFTPSSGSGVISTSSVEYIGSVGAYLWFDGASAVIFNRSNVLNVPFIIQGMVSQSANLTDWRDGAGANIASMSSSGRLTHKGFTVGTTAPASPAVGDVWIDTAA